MQNLFLWSQLLCVFEKKQKTMVAAEGEILPRLALIDNTFQQKQKSSQKKQRLMYFYYNN